MPPSPCRPASGPGWPGEDRLRKSEKESAHEKSVIMELTQDLSQCLDSTC